MSSPLDDPAHSPPGGAAPYDTSSSNEVDLAEAAASPPSPGNTDGLSVPALWIAICVQATSRAARASASTADAAADMVKLEAEIEAKVRSCLELLETAAWDLSQSHRWLTQKERYAKSERELEQLVNELVERTLQLYPAEASSAGSSPASSAPTGRGSAAPSSWGKTHAGRYYEAKGGAHDEASRGKGSASEGDASQQTERRAEALAYYDLARAVALRLTEIRSAFVHQERCMLADIVRRSALLIAYSEKLRPADA
ncbi:MAG: hypothetical protein MI919_10665, partial [Holophagales bacterium]|nr:hypothetical protein [Holophagales bacterium]